MANRSLVSFLVLFFALAIPQVHAQTLGVPVYVLANTVTPLTYAISGAMLTIEINENANVTLYGYSGIPSFLPGGNTLLSFGSYIGFQLDIGPTATLTSATLVTSALTASSAALITGAVSAGCLEVDIATQFFSEVFITSYSLGVITVDLPVAGAYIFTAIQLNSPVPTFYNQARALVSDTRAYLDYSESFFINVTAQSSSQLTVTFSETTTYAAPPKMFSLDAYFDITISPQATVAASLEYSYNETLVTSLALNESSLQFGWYDTTSNSWKFDGGAQVNLNGTKVSQPVSHFSVWGVFGSTPVSSANSIMSSYVLLVTLFLVSVQLF